MTSPLYVFALPPSESMDSVRPWVARIVGTSPKYGLDRRFVSCLTDYTDASVSCRGRKRGIRHSFALHVGWVVELAHYTGTASRRYLRRYFAVVREGGLEEMTREDVRAWAVGVEQARLDAAVVVT